MSPAENLKRNQGEPAKNPNLNDCKETMAILGKEKQTKSEQWRQHSAGEISVHQNGQASRQQNNFTPPPFLLLVGVIRGPHEQHDRERNKVGVPDQAAFFEKPRREQRGSADDQTNESPSGKAFRQQSNQQRSAKHPKRSEQSRSQNARRHE